MTATVEAAVALGLPTFPCGANKSPAIPGPGGHKHATDNPMAIRELWRCNPGPLVGVATGVASGFDVLDIDAPQHPEAAEWWARYHCRLPATRTHETRSGGKHMLFRHTAGLRSWAGRPVPGVDGRSTGGYIVWWPAAGLPVLCDAPPAPWPTWLLEDLQPSSSPARSESRVTIPDEYALAALVRKVAGAAVGERNTITFWAACRAGEMAASGLIGAATAAAVIANAALLSGLPPAEAERTAWSGIRTGMGGATHA
jgi:hypothetical protein